MSRQKRVRTNEVVNASGGRAIETEESINTWDTTEERAKQIIVPWEELEAKTINKMIKELNATLMLLNLKPGKLCQRDLDLLSIRFQRLNELIATVKLAQRQQHLYTKSVQLEAHSKP